MPERIARKSKSVQRAPRATQEASPPEVHVPSAHRCETCRVRKFSVCSALEIGELPENEHVSRPICYAPKSALLREGETSNAVFSITSGIARLSRTLPNGQRQIVGFALPGDFLGLDLNEHVNFSVEAVNHVIACRFERAAFIEYLYAKKHLMVRLHELAGQEILSSHNHMIVLGRKSADGKIAAFLINLHDRLMRLDHVHAHIPLAMTRQDIGDYVGLSIESVSRTLNNFARRKLIVITPDGVRLLNEEKLRIMCEL